MTLSFSPIVSEIICLIKIYTCDRRQTDDKQTDRQTYVNGRHIVSYSWGLKTSRKDERNTKRRFYNLRILLIVQMHSHVYVK